MPNISVCIPTYNREHLLKETLDSVFAQTYRDFEVVIVDDGSTDGTKQMLEKNGYDVRYHWQENAGDANARNKLIELADGKYISFLDSDDLLYPDALEKMIKAMPQGAEDIVVYGPYVSIDEHGDILRKSKKKLFDGRITRNLFENILIHSCGSLFPKKILVEAGCFDVSLSVCSDYDLWLRLSLDYDFISIDKPVFKRRRHSGNLSRVCFANSNMEYRVLENFYYNGGGRRVIPYRAAMVRLSKEQYRAARNAIRESMRTTACDFLTKSLKRHFHLKTLFWFFISQTGFHPALWSKTDRSNTEEDSRALVKRPRTISDIRVAIDFDPVVINKFSGFYTFGMGLLKGFATIKDKPELMLFHSSHFALRVKEVIKNELPENMESKTLTIKMRWLEDLWRYSNYPKLEHLTGDFDIYHCFHHLMPPTDGKCRIMTVHDLRRYKLPQLYKESRLDRFENAVRKADHFIAVSQSTKNDLCSVFKIDANKVDVISLAAGFEPLEYSAEQKNSIKLQLSEKLGQKLDDYLVVISSPDRRKNILRTVEAFESVQTALPKNLKLAVIGQLPKREEEFVKKLKSCYYPNVFWAGVVDDLRPWLGCAKALIFASLYEGFGIPILEGFSCGTAVITSNISSMPEVGGDAVLYVDPLSTESIADAIIKISNDEKLRNNLIKAGAERNKQFTWKKTAEDVIKVYKKLAGI
jgi:glycosyltransferase involved in cell wall biosynthesis